MKGGVFALAALFCGCLSAVPARSQPAAQSNMVPGLPGGATTRPKPPPDYAFGAYQRGYFVTALRYALQRVSANPKDAAAMTLIGQIYMDGIAVNHNAAEADRWFALAANLGDRQATFALGLAYLVGDGVKKNLDRATELFKKAAAQGHAGALYNLGVLAIEGDNKNFAAAADYFRRASKAGDVESDYALAMLYRAGKGVPLDRNKATHWLRRAADQHDLDAEVEYGIALFNGDGVKRNEALAAKYLLEAAARNNPVAQDRIARMLAAGRGAPKDLVQAMKWHILAEAAGVKDAWLDQQLAKLAPRQRVDLRKALKRYVGY